MVLSKKFFNQRASSILESVIALSIISVCLYIAIIVYANVFAAKFNLSYYERQHKIDEAFFILQIAHDTLIEEYDSVNWIVEEELINSTTKKINIIYKDSLHVHTEKEFYIRIDEN